MKTRIVCLANSYKEGGRCVAGIELDSKNQIVYKDFMPNWIRPVCKTTHGEIPVQLVSNIRPLDILEFAITEPVPSGFQTENVLFEEESLKVVGVFEKEKIYTLGINNRNNIFGNSGKALTPEMASNLTYSLMLISIGEFEILEIKYEDCERPKVRLKFKYGFFDKDLSITDPIFLEKYKHDRDILKNINQIYAVLSVGILYEDWHSKLVACILF